MKFSATSAMIALTVAFALLIGGIYLSRYTDRGQIQVSAYVRSTTSPVGSVQEPPTDADDQQININTASLAQLMTLPGIGEKKAQAIIDHREKFGTFDTIYEILDVDGVGEGIFEKIRNLITV